MSHRKGKRARCDRQSNEMIHKKPRVAGNFGKNRKNEPQEPIRHERRERALRVWESSTVLNLLGASKDAGWVVAMIVICITTFALSTVFVKVFSFAKSLRPFV